MMRELVCKHVEKKKRRYVFLTAALYKVGKALENDILLLDANVPPVLATIEDINGTYVWKQGFQTVDLEKNTHTVGGYSFHVRNDRKYFYALAFAFLVLGLVFVFREILGSNPEKVMSSSITVGDARELEKSFGQNGVELFNAAQKFFHERNLRAGNLVRAQQMITQVKNHYDSLNQKVPSEIFKLSESIQEEKKKWIQDHRIVAQRFQQQGYPEKSRKVYRKLLAELIDRADPDRKMIENEMRNFQP